MTHPRGTRLRLPLGVRIAGALLAASFCCVVSGAFHYLPDGNEPSFTSVAISLCGAMALSAAVYWFLSLPMRRGEDE